MSNTEQDNKVNDNGYMPNTGLGQYNRTRKKNFYNEIRKQIEFYLGDVNLSKDGFFSNVLRENDYVSMDIILKCNKIKNLSASTEDIIKALKKSELLLVSQDGTKISRKIPVAPVENEEECTIYVEKLPTNSDRDLIKSVFNTYGKIEYISMPHFKETQKSKGFAFVQFDCVESANKAIEAFRSVNAYLSTSMSPQKLKSVKTFEGEKNIVLPPQKNTSTQSIKFENVTPIIKEEKTLTNDIEKDKLIDLMPPPKDLMPLNKRRHLKMEGKNEDEQPAKKRKLIDEKATKMSTSTEYEVKVNSDTIKDKSKDEKLPKKRKLEKKENNDSEKKNKKVNVPSNESELNKITSTDEKKEKKKHASKAKIHERYGNIRTFGMKLLSKSDWKKLRNKHLEDLRKSMSQIKLNVRYDENEELESEHISNTIEENSNNIENDSQQYKHKKNEPISEMRVTFIPGVIVKAEFDTAIKEIKNFKNETKRFVDVEYIDVSEDGKSVHFRCASNEKAQQLLLYGEKWCHTYLLEGEEEVTYWNKIRSDRKVKFEQNIKCNIRGKTRLKQKCQHIRF